MDYTVGHGDVSLYDGCTHPITVHVHCKKKVKGYTLWKYNLLGQLTHGIEKNQRIKKIIILLTVNNPIKMLK